MAHILQRDRAQPAPRRLREMELDRLRLRGRRGDFFHPIDLLELALRLRRLARLRPEAIGKKLERRDLLLLVLVGGELLLFARRFLLDVAVPVPAITEQLGMRDLDDAADERVQKFAIVRDHEDRAGIILQIILEPD